MQNCRVFLWTVYTFKFLHVNPIKIEPFKDTESIVIFLISSIYNLIIVLCARS